MTLSKELISSDATEIYEKNFVDVFVILIIQLDLSGNGEKGWRNYVRSSYPYSFTHSEAYKEMENLKLLVELKLVTTTIKYNIRRDLAAALLSKFFSAHLLHDPASRTVSTLKSASRLQVSPKGAALVFEFCKNLGMREELIPSIVFSNINTMLLFHFDRSPTTSKALHSVYLSHVLITTIMGAAPNVWHPEQEPAPLKNIFYEDYANNGEHAIGEKVFPKGKLLSPFFHRYFSNPQSEAHIQYYESSSGMRLFHNREFKDGNKTTVVKYCFSGKALVQWLCDCSTLNSTCEASEIGQLLLDKNLIVPVTISLFSENFYNHSDAIYTLSETGSESCIWWKRNHSIQDHCFSISEEAEHQRTEPCIDDDLSVKKRKITLDYVLRDPGMRYMFRRHLEKQSCLDNFDAYLELQDFIGRKTICSRMIQQVLRAKPEEKQKLRETINSFATSNTLMAFHIYSKFFSLESVYNLNIGFGLQQELDYTIGNVERLPQSPTRSICHDISAYLKTPDIETFLSSPTTPGDNESRAGSNANAQDDQNSHEMKLASLKEESSVSTYCGSNEELQVSPFNANLEPKSLDPIFSRDLSSMEESVNALKSIWKVFDKVAASLYQMMESDLFPKFVCSHDFAVTIDAITKST